MDPEIASTVPAITTQAACEGTTVIGSFWTRGTSSWILIGSKSDTGEWSNATNTCTEPVIEAHVYPNVDGWVTPAAEFRVATTVKRVTCSGGGAFPLCAITYGSAVRVTGGSHPHY